MGGVQHGLDIGESRGEIAGVDVGVRGGRRGDHALKEALELAGAVDRCVEPAGQRAALRLSAAGIGQDSADTRKRGTELVGDGVDQIAAQPVGLFQPRGQACLFVDVRAVVLIGAPADDGLRPPGQPRPPTPG